MKTISIRELHQETGQWVRRASEGEIHVTERGRLIATIIPARPRPSKVFFSKPRFTRAFLAHRREFRGGSDITKGISEDRDRSVS